MIKTNRVEVRSTRRHAGRRLGGVCVALVALAASFSPQLPMPHAPAVAFAQGPEGEPPRAWEATTPNSRDEHAMTVHVLAAANYSFGGGTTAVLTLNNKGPEPLRVQPTLLARRGTALEPAPITVPGDGHLNVDISTLTGGDPGFSEGQLQLMYEGGDLQLGAQVRLVTEAQSLVFDEQLVEFAKKFSSTELEAVWWTPAAASTVTLALANTNRTESISMSVTVRNGPSSTGSGVVALGPGESTLLNVSQTWLGGAAIAQTGAITVSHDGEPGDGLAYAMATAHAVGFSLPLEFQDQGMRQSSSLHGAGLRLQSVAGQSLTPVVVVRNVGSVTTVVGGSVPYTTVNGTTGAVTLPNLSLTPGAVGTFQASGLNPSLAEQVAAAGLELTYATPPGSVVASAFTVSANRTHVFRVPLLDPEAQQSSSGGYPWLITENSSTVVYLKNVTNTPRTYHLQLNYNGGLYSPGQKSIGPGQTVALDIKALRDAQVPDEEDYAIPAGANKGQVVWTIEDDENLVLIGRSEQISAAAGLSSTYACQNCCPDSFFSARTKPFPLDGFPGDTTRLLPVVKTRDCYGTIHTSVGDAFFEWLYPNPFSSADPTIASVVASTGDVTFGNVFDTTYVYARFRSREWGLLSGDCVLYIIESLEGVPTTVRPRVRIEEVGFTSDHKLTSWVVRAPIDPDDSAPTWKRDDNPEHPASYTKGTNPSIFAKLSITPAAQGSAVPVQYRVRYNKKTVATGDALLLGDSISLGGITLNSVTEQSVRRSSYKFQWEISYSNGQSWTSIGESGSHVIYWVHAQPHSPPFQDLRGQTYYPLYDFALEKACGYSNGKQVPADIVNAINTKIFTDPQITYKPDTELGAGVHPLSAYGTACLCADLAALLQGLLCSVGIAGEFRFYWAGPNTTTMRRYVRGSEGGDPFYTFRVTRQQHPDGVEANPHFFYHAVIAFQGRLYDPSYGIDYVTLTFSETADNNTAPQQHSGTFPTHEVTTPKYVCPH